MCFTKFLHRAADRDLPDDSPPGTPIAVGTSVANAYLLRYCSLPPVTRDILILAAGVAVVGAVLAFALVRERDFVSHGAAAETVAPA